MNFDDYINDLQSDIDSQLSQFGLNGDSDKKKFCPECGTQVMADANFCPECGYNFNADSNNEDLDESDVQEGIIWTDTKVLAAKYKTTRNAVQSIIKGFISANEHMDLCWHLLDMADHQSELGEATWMDYSEVLQHYIEKNGIIAGPHLSLFIIGGYDVIPQPIEANPCEGNTEWDDVIDYHCYYDCYRECFIVQEDVEYWGNTENNQLKPATKEQRDLLFSKMKEAGYEWDAEKKELKKIHNALEECEIENIEHGKYYYCIKDYFAGGKKQASKGDVVQALRGLPIMALGVKANEYFLPVNSIKQKTDWSEDDESTIKDIIEDLEYAERKGYVLKNNTFLKEIYWLNSLKERLKGE